MGRREQMQRQRQAAVGNRWMVGEAKQFLHADREDRRAVALVVDARRLPVGAVEMRRRDRVQTSRKAHGSSAVERVPSTVGVDVGERRLPSQEGESQSVTVPASVASERSGQGGP